jgi:hypothetical protein
MRLLSLTEGASHGYRHKSRERVAPWNKGKLLGQKPPLKLKDIWAIRIRLQFSRRSRELALFNLAIDSKLRECDLVALRVHDVLQGTRVTSRAIVMQKKTERACAVRDHGTNSRCDCRMDGDGTPETRSSFSFRVGCRASPHLSTRQYARIVGSWVGPSCE